MIEKVDRKTKAKLEIKAVEEELKNMSDSSASFDNWRPSTPKSF